MKRCSWCDKSILADGPIVEFGKNSWIHIECKKKYVEFYKVLAKRWNK
jgi:predicted nucleic-acid-binding Zn-ribbon protein